MSVLLVQRMGFRDAITAQLAQTMALLELPISDLEARVTQELAANPALEVVAEGRCPQCGRRLRQLPCPVCKHSLASAGDLEVCLSSRPWREAGQPTRNPGGEHLETAERRAPETLPDHVMRQVGPMLDVADQPIAAYLLTNLDDRGFLLEAPAVTAEALHVSLDRVESVLNAIRHADPPGLGAQNVRECLLLQLELLEEEGRGHALARAILTNHWDTLGRYDLGSTAHELEVSRQEVEAAIAFIRGNLTPYPAYLGWHTDSNLASSEVIACGPPDAAITRLEDDRGERLQIEVFTPIAGWLRVAPAFKTALSDCPRMEQSCWEPYIARARQFVTSLRYRNGTLSRLLLLLVREQRQFVLGGVLRPMTRAELAPQLGLHESTISRTVAHKQVALPSGRILPLTSFFDRSLPVRQAMKLIITTETQPLADDEIAARLAEQGYRVARRTITKYRAAEGIPPAAARAMVAG